MPDLANLVSVIAAAVSAIGGAFAAVAAFRSAASARQAQEAALAYEKRTALRQLELTVTEVLFEAELALRHGNQLKLSYRSLAAFSGALGGSREKLCLDEVDGKLREVTSLSEPARSYVLGTRELLKKPTEALCEEERIFAVALVKVRGIREDLDRTHDQLERQQGPYRDRAAGGSNP